jgi:GTP pyrophosphokinase
VQRDEAKKLPKGLTWVSELTDIQKSTASGQEFVEGVRLELFADRIFVFSPKGDLYDLPEGATPVDFAFAIHSDVGLRALGARVNGKMVPLETRLENRDVVEIITKRESAPNRDWLNFVVTSHAKNRIRAWFRSTSREGNIASGKAMLEEELRQTWEIKRVEELPKRAVAETLDALSLKTLDDLYAQIGDGSVTLTSVIRRLLPDAAKPADARRVKRVEPTGRVMVEGTKLPYTLAPCCNPVFPQPLIGYVTRGRGVTVHTLGCRNIPDDVERYTACRWETAGESRERLVCHVEIKAVNRIGLLADVTSLVADMKINLAGISSREEDHGNIMVNFGIEVPDMFVLARIIRMLEKLPGVSSAYRVQ